MNYCRKCQSDYEKPGTCNCFAPQIQVAPGVVPYIPWVPYVPTYPPCIPWWQTTTVTQPITTTTPYIVTNSIRADQLPPGTQVTYTS